MRSPDHRFSPELHRQSAELNRKVADSVRAEALRASGPVKERLSILTEAYLRKAEVDDWCAKHLEMVSRHEVTRQVPAGESSRLRAQQELLDECFGLSFTVSQ